MASQHFNSERGDPDGDDGPDFRYIEQYINLGFNQLQSEHLASMAAWFPSSALDLFPARSTELSVQVREYGDLYEDLIDLSKECTTRTETYLMKALVEGYLSQDFDFTIEQIVKCSKLEAAQRRGTVFFHPEERMWWPSISEHWYAMDYRPTFQSFTQLTALFALAHVSPDLSHDNLLRLKKDERLYASDKGLWVKQRFAFEDSESPSESYMSRDQLMAILVLCITDPELACQEFSRFKSSELFKDGLPVHEVGKYCDETRGNQVDVLLLSLAEVLVLPPPQRSVAMEVLKEDPQSGYVQETGRWTTLPARKHEATSCEFMMQRLLSVLLNNLKTDR